MEKAKDVRKSGLNLKRQRNQNPNIDNNSLAKKSRTKGPDFIPLELTTEAADAAMTKFRDLTQQLSTIDIANVQSAAAMSYPKGEVPPTALILESRAWAEKGHGPPNTFPRWLTWQYQKVQEGDIELAEQAKALRQAESPDIATT